MDMRMILLAAASSLFVQPSLAQCGLHLHGGGLPPLGGRAVFQSCDTVDCDASDLYTFDFSNNSIAEIDMSSTPLRVPLNPVFSPDGSALVFSAVTVDAPAVHRLYYWTLATGDFVALTAATNRSEDAKFSPDGNHLVWKQDFGIETADFSVAANGKPRLSHRKTVVTGTNGEPDEASAPVYSTDQSRIYYYTGSRFTEPTYYPKIQQYIPGQGSSLAFDRQKKNIQYYYPADLSAQYLLFVSWLNAGNQHDKIFVYSKSDGSRRALNKKDCDAENSDPAPVDGDYYLFSRLGPDGGDRYVFYLGQATTGFVRSLVTFAINNVPGFLLGANYSVARPTRRSGFAKR